MTEKMYQQPLFRPESSWTCPTEFPDLSAAKMIAFDIESKDPRLQDLGPGYVRGDAYVAGVSVCTDDLQYCRYFPVRHEEGPNLAGSVVFDWLAEQLGRPEQEKVAANAIYDMEGLWYSGVKIAGKINDIQIAEPLLNEDSLEGYSLDVLAKKYLGVGKDEELLEAAAFAWREGKRDKEWRTKMKSRLHRFPAQYVGPYAEMDSMRTMQVFLKQRELLEKEELGRVYDVETRLLKLLLAMRIKGVPFDLDQADRLSKKWRLEEAQLKEEIWRDAGFAVDPWTPTDLEKLFKALGAPYKKTEKGNPSFENEYMEDVGVPNPFKENGKKKDLLTKIRESQWPSIQRVVRFRKINKMRRDFCDGYREFVVRGRIHAQFHPLRKDEEGTRSGRFSSTRPNLQQVPHRDPEFSAEVRSMFIPEEGKIWIKRDYSQQEPRLTIHYAHLRQMPGAEAAWKQFNDNPFTDYHQMVADMAGISRGDAKGINLGLAYSMGKKKMARQLGRTMAEAEPIFALYHSRLPYMKLLATECDHMAQSRGYIKTLLGRRRHFDYWELDLPYDPARPYVRPLPRERALEAWPGQRLRRADTRKAMNGLIQGGGADMTKMAMLTEFEEFNEVPYAQVHDELDSGVESLEHAVMLQRKMETCIPWLTVPMIAEIEHGSNWGYLTKLADARRV
jgi:DNA polymerase I-like protein with 3'-5' exonuclease and polymerase domains